MSIRRHISYLRGLLRCSFRLQGQCEGLYKRDEQQTTDSHAFFIHSYYVRIRRAYRTISILSMLKYIIVVTGKSNTGKTTMFNQLWDLLPSFYTAEKVIYYSTDFNITGHVEPKIIDSHPVNRLWRTGIHSSGDLQEDIQQGLVDLIHSDCDVVVVASRSENMFINAINTILSTKIISRMVKRGVTKSDCIKAQQTIFDSLGNIIPSIIFCSHFQKYYKDKITLSNLMAMTSPPHPVNPIVGGVDLNRVFAQHLVDLIERLRK